MDLPDLAVSEVGAVVDKTEGLLWEGADMAQADGWLGDFAARDGDGAGVVASLVAEEGGLPLGFNSLMLPTCTPIGRTL